MVTGVIVSFTSVNSEAILNNSFIGGFDPTYVKFFAGLVIGYASIYPHRIQQLLQAFIVDKTNPPGFLAEVVDESENTVRAESQSKRGNG